MDKMNASAYRFPLIVFSLGTLPSLRTLSFAFICLSSEASVNHYLTCEKESGGGLHLSERRRRRTNAIDIVGTERE